MNNLTSRRSLSTIVKELWWQQPYCKHNLCPCEPDRAAAKKMVFQQIVRETTQLQLDFMAVASLVQTGINAGARVTIRNSASTLLRRNYGRQFLLLALLSLTFLGGLGSQSLNQRLEAVLAGEKVNADREFSALTRAKAEEFDETSKSLLLQIVASENIINQADYILLAGFLYGEELLPFVPETARKSAAVRRAINLAKVRAGNEDRTANLLKNVKKIPLDDEFTYTVVPMLIYTRQRAVLDYLLELVMISNSNCTPGDAETSGQIDCGYRLIEHLAVAIAEFPVAVDEDGDLLDNDYAAALIKVREWITLNKPYYTILTNTY